MSKFRFVLSRLTHARNSFGLGLNDNPIQRPLSLLTDICSGPLCEKLHGVRCFSSAEVPSHIVLNMPALSPTMSQGNIAKWRKKEGDKIAVGDVICEIETDKATLEFESLEEGFLAKIIAPEGSKDVLVGQPIAVTVEDPDDIKNVAAGVINDLEMKEEKMASLELGEKGSSAERISDKSTFRRISPSAKLLITEFGLDAASIKASGPRGTLLKGDVLAVINSRGGSSTTCDPLQEKISATSQSSKVDSHSSPPQSSNYLQVKDTYEDLPNNQIRKVIAKRLLESKQNIPHLYLSSDVILDPLLAFRNVIKEQHNIKVSINDIIIKAVALALRNVPEANACWNDEKGEATLCDTVDISIAVATDKGLMTPIVRNADQKSLLAISLEVKELAEKARTGKLAPGQYQGGTFSISNLGMFPVDHFCAIINPPQACIMAVGQGNKVVEPVVGSDGTEIPTIVTKISLKLSADHRVFDGEIGGKFLSALALNLGDVQRLLL